MLLASIDGSARRAALLTQQMSREDLKIEA
jgi:hypothetical protein